MVSLHEVSPGVNGHYDLNRLLTKVYDQNIGPPSEKVRGIVGYQYFQPSVCLSMKNEFLTVRLLAVSSI